MTPTILTIGNFDGVHLGHRQLISSTIALARSWCGHAIAITFSPHPRQFFSPSDHFFLYPQKIKEKMLNSLGLDEVIYLPFKEIYRLTPEQFFDTILLPLEPAAIVLGNNFTFGANKSGDLNLLRKFCASHDIALHSLTMMTYGGQPVSSSRIRTAIQNGNIQQANDMLGAPYTLYGEVIRGAGRGHLIGFPTANIHPVDQVMPKCGAYVTQVRIESGNELYPAMTAVTQTPTFDHVETRLETPIPNFSQDLYGKQISVAFCRFLREEMVFESTEDLVDQLRRDCLEIGR